MLKPEPIYDDIEKIDAHVHQNTTRPALLDEGRQEGFSLVTINTQVPEFPDTDQQREIALACREQAPGTLNFIASFSTEGWGDSDWAEKALDQIQKGIAAGAVAVKIWKDIGMDLRDVDGSFVMADHPALDPIYEYLVREEIPLIAHLGEPKNCWLPLEEMTVTSDRDYFTNNPRYHMYLHKEYPSYTQQLEARDRMLARHPKLTFISAHLASLEWSVDEQAAWLDAHPGAGVDLAERVCHLQYQAATHYSKVRDFVETYQDRIIYGSDQIEDGSMESDELRQTVRTKWRNEFQFFAGSEEQTAWNVDRPFRGLGLDKKILEKLFRSNAIHYYPRITDHLQG